MSIRVVASTQSWRRPSAHIAQLMGSVSSLREEPIKSYLEAISKNDEAERAHSSCELDELYVWPGELFGAQLCFDLPDAGWLCLGQFADIPWWGMDSCYRLELRLHDLQTGQEISTKALNETLPVLRDACGIDISPVSCDSSMAELSLYHMGFVLDDDLFEKADKLLINPAQSYPKGELRIFFKGRIAPELAGKSLELHIKLYKRSGYEESELSTKTLALCCSQKIYNYKLHNGKDSFFLDLWQHPCAWARAHELPYWSEEHFDLIGKYFARLATLGQKVCLATVSDMPWAGQECYKVDKQPARLYEYQLLQITKTMQGQLHVDFSIFDRYVQLAQAAGICQELDLIGLLGNWHAEDFGNPLLDYSDPIRLRFYDEKTQRYSYLSSKEELAFCLSQLFEHLEARGLSQISYLMSDQPLDLTLFKRHQEFLQSCSPFELRYKLALNSAEFLQYELDTRKQRIEAHPSNVADKPNLRHNEISLCTLLLAEAQDFEDEHGFLSQASWYNCCYPEQFNSFLRSPLIELRLAGLYTYLWKMKGMMRWAYACYGESGDDLRYKSYEWPAGDMQLVYPGKHGAPLGSLREFNLLCTIQDFNKLQHLGVSREYLAAQSGVQGLVRKVERLEDGSHFRPINHCFSHEIEIDSSTTCSYTLADWLKLLRRLEEEGRSGLSTTP